MSAAATDYTLSYGRHATPEEGRCAMEWVSYLAGEPHSDQPDCVSPVLRAFCVSFNDDLDDDKRQRLRPYLARTIGTSGDGLDETRAWMAMDWLVRTYTPAWLELTGLDATAARLRELSPVLASEPLGPALDELAGARHHARVAWVGGRQLARLAPWSAARNAARETAWACAAAAAWAAARIGVGDVAGDRARAAARAAAGDAAGAHLRAIHGNVSRSGARAAARTALAPTITELQRSAFVLLDRMLPTVGLLAPVVRDADAVCGRV